MSERRWENVQGKATVSNGILERLQSNCNIINTVEAIELGRQIVMLAKQIDEVEKSKPDNVTVKWGVREPWYWH